MRVITPWFLLMFLSTAVATAVGSNEAALISLVLEPFEEHPLGDDPTAWEEDYGPLDFQVATIPTPVISDDDSSDNGVIVALRGGGEDDTTTGTLPPRSPAYAGSSYLGIDFTAQDTSSWNNKTTHAISVQRLLPDPHVYMAQGSQRLSFWIRRTCHYNQSLTFCPQVKETTATLFVRAADNQIEHWTYIIIGDNDMDMNTTLQEGKNNEWLQIQIPIVKFSDTTAGPDENKSTIDTNRIQGWRLDLQVSIQNQQEEAHDSGVPENGGGDASTTPATMVHVAIDIDHIALDGPGELLGALFTVPSWDTLVEQESIEEVFYRSPVSVNETRTVLDGSGKLDWKYTVERTESWGGFVAYRYPLPYPSYYNLSQAESIMFDYEIISPVTVADAEGKQVVGNNRPLHFRLMLEDFKGCVEDCQQHFNFDVEVYYSFHYILDQPEGKSETQILDLIGDGSATSTWSRPGWTGSLRNDVLDKDVIKGFRLEASIDGDGPLGSFARGEFSISNLRASPISKESDLALLEESFTIEPFIRFSPDHANFRGEGGMNYAACLRECLSDPNCNYVLAVGAQCHIARFLRPDSSIVYRFPDAIETEDGLTGSTSLWKTNAGGNFCTVCLCKADSGMIDCRGRNLAILPYTFNETIWTAKKLDLRENPMLTFIGSGSFDQLPLLEELILPRNLEYVSNTTLMGLKSLRTLSFEDSFENSDDQTTFANIIPDSGGSFRDVCCEAGSHLDVTGNDGQVDRFQFCDVLRDSTNADTVFEPFLSYFFGYGALATIAEYSGFMSEAAESADKCGSYCEFFDGCKYFVYENRVSIAEHVCRMGVLYTNSSVHDPDNWRNYADQDMEFPGVVRGRVARARHIDDNAKVIIQASSGLQAMSKNGYTVDYTVRLGGNPRRGAVWIEPRISNRTSLASDVEVEIVPKRVILNNNETNFTVHVRVLNPRSGSVVIDNVVQSCDQAFTSFGDSEGTQNLVVFDVVKDTTSKTSVIVATFLVGVFILLAAFFGTRIAIERKRRKQDRLWLVSMSELKFKDPHEVVGYGTFGIVVLATYRGTQVAVKSVLPPRSGVSAFRNATIPKNSGPDENKSTVTSDNSTTAFSVELGTSTIYPGVLSKNESSFHTKQESPRVFAKKQWKKAAKFFETDLASRESGGQEFSARQRRRHWEKSLEFYNLNTNTLRADFIAEMRHLSKLRHPCVTTCMGAVVENRYDPLLVMEYMDRGSLSDLLQNETVVMDGEQILPILRDVASGVRFLHASTPLVVHGDLKARNILVDSKFRAKVTDFGLSQKKRIGASGTPYWMAPELLMGTSDNTKMSDAYSFGIIMFEVYARADPYDGEEFLDVLEGVVDPLINKRPGYPESSPPEIRSLMAECLHRLPEQRPSFETLDIVLKGMDAKTLRRRSSYQGLTLQEKSLVETFPPHVAKALQEGNNVEPEDFEMVTIANFSVVGFDEMASLLPAKQVSEVLETLSGMITLLSEEHGVFIVDAVSPAHWIAVTNLLNQVDDHVKRMVEFAEDLVVRTKRVFDQDKDQDNRSSSQKISLRVGLHSGPCVANVVGGGNLHTGPRYCLFGEAVKIASRIGSKSEGDRVLCSQKSAHLLRQQDPDRKLINNGEIHVMGSLIIGTMWVETPESRPHFQSAALTGIEEDDESSED